MQLGENTGKLVQSLFVTLISLIKYYLLLLANQVQYNLTTAYCICKSSS